MASASPTDCVHCATPGACSHLCDRCPCLHCVTRRDTPDTDAWCLACVRWVGQFGAGIRATIAQVAMDRGTTLAQARAQLLTDYHRQHLEEQ